MKLGEKLGRLFFAICMLGLLFTCIGGQLPDSASAAENQVLEITGSVVNVRSGPGLEHSLVSRVSAGDKLPLLASKQDWYQVTLSDGREGWIANWLGEVQNQDISAVAGVDPIGKAIVTGSYVNIRRGPGLEHEQVHRVHRGEQLSLLASSGDWHQIELAGERTGWIASWLIEVEQEEQKEQLNHEEQENQVDQVDQVDQEDQVAGPSDEKQETGGAAQQLQKVATSLVDNLNVRVGPGTSHQVLETLDKDEFVPVVEDGQDWIKVELPDGSKGWLASWLIELGEVSYQPEAGETKSETKPETGLEADLDAESGESENGGDRQQYLGSIEVLGTVVNVRSGAGTSFDRIDQVTKGAELLVVAEEDGWYQVELGDDQKAWIIGRYATFNAELTGEKLEALKSEQNKVPGLDSNALAGKLIVLDAGHGGLNSLGWNDPGAIGPTGVVEREVVLDIAKRLQLLLEAQGAKVVMTRTSKTTNLSLTERGELANNINGDIFVSIHANASLSSWQNGTMVFYYANGPQQAARKKLAGSLQSELVKGLRLRDMGVRQSNFSVLRNTTVPSALVEVAFLSNPDEEKLLANPQFRQRSAEALEKGINKYFSEVG